MDLDKLENRMVIDAYWDDNDTDLLDDYEEYDPVEYAERMEYLYDKVEDLV
jgi:HEPN domain-containing protein